MRPVLMALAEGFMIVPNIAAAGTIDSGLAAPAGDNESTDLFVGLNWTFGGTRTLQGVVGVMYTEIDRSGEITGGRASVSVDLLGRGLSPDVRLTGLLGDEGVAAEAGLGVRLDGSGLFGVVGGVTDYVQGGATIDFNGGRWGGYVGAHSFDDFDDEPDPGRPAPRIRRPRGRVTGQGESVF